MCVSYLCCAVCRFPFLHDGSVCVIGPAQHVFLSVCLHLGWMQLSICTGLEMTSQPSQQRVALSLSQIKTGNPPLSLSPSQLLLQ